MTHARCYWFVTAKDMNQMCFVSPHWAESSLFPWRAQGAARVNDVIAGRVVQSALVPASSSVNYPPTLQVLAQSTANQELAR